MFDDDQSRKRFFDGMTRYVRAKLPAFYNTKAHMMQFNDRVPQPILLARRIEFNDVKSKLSNDSFDYLKRHVSVDLLVAHTQEFGSCAEFVATAMVYAFLWAIANKVASKKFKCSVVTPVVNDVIYDHVLLAFEYQGEDGLQSWFYDPVQGVFAVREQVGQVPSVIWENVPNIANPLPSQSQQQYQLTKRPGTPENSVRLVSPVIHFTIANFRVLINQFSQVLNLAQKYINDGAFIDPQGVVPIAAKPQKQVSSELTWCDVYFDGLDVNLRQKLLLKLPATKKMVQGLPDASWKVAVYPGQEFCPAQLFCRPPSRESAQLLVAQLRHFGLFEYTQKSGKHYISYQVTNVDGTDESLEKLLPIPVRVAP